MQPQFTSLSSLRFGKFTHAQESRIAVARGDRAGITRTVDPYLAKYMDKPLESDQVVEVDLSHLPEMSGSKAAALVDDIEKQFRKPKASLYDLFSKEDPAEQQQKKLEKLDEITQGLRQGAFRVPDTVVNMLEWAYNQLK